MFWTKPRISKIYEALGAIGDERIEFIENKNEARINSSSRNKFYTITWNDDLSQMMSNDNAAYYVGQISYPMISILMLKGKVKHNEKLPELFKGIKWKDINKKFKNNYDKTVELILSELKEKGSDIDFIKNEVQKIKEQLDAMQIDYFGERVRPPLGY